MDRESLERNAQIFLAPPNLVTPAERQSAEKFFLEFRQTKSPYELCQELLETSTVDFVLFEAAGLIGEALLREWPFLPKENIIFMEEYLSYYLINHRTLAPFVKKRILQVIATIVKRMSADDRGELCRVLMSQIEQLMVDSDLHGQLIGCGVMSALIQEFVATNKSSSIGVRCVQHYELRKLFEYDNIKKIFLLCFTRLSELTMNITEETLPLIRNLLSILESVMSWPFGKGKRLVKFFRKAVDPNSLNLNDTWTDIIINPEFLQLFFSLYKSVRTNMSLAHHAKNSLVLLSGLDGTVFENDTMKIQYIIMYMTEFINLVSNIEIIDQEAIDIATIISNLVRLSMPFINSLPKDLLNSFIDHFLRLTRVFVMGEAQKELICDDENLYMQASNLMFVTWSTLLSKERGECALPDKFQLLSLQIFDTFLKCKLSPPEGLRVISNKELESEVTEIEENDREKYLSRLQMLGVIGRQILEQLLPLLAQFIEERTLKLQQELSIVNITKNNNCYKIPEIIQNLYEDIHWLILLSGHVLCYEKDLTRTFRFSGIPSEIKDYLIDQLNKGKTDPNVTMQLLASPQCNITDIPGANESADHVIRLITSVLRICKIFLNVLNANMMFILSPELIGTTIWFLKFCVSEYILLDEIHFSHYGVSVFREFDKYRESSQWMINELLDYLKNIMNAFKGEEILVNECIEFLSSLFNVEVNALCVLKSDRLGYFIELATANEFTLPQSSKRKLINAIVKAGLGFEVLADRERYWTQMLERFEKKFTEILSRNDINSVCHDEYIKLQVTELLDYFIGITEAVNEEMPRVMKILVPVFNQMEKLLPLYQNYPEIMKLIFELLHCSAEKIYKVFETNEIRRFWRIYLNCINIYIRINKNRFTINWIDNEDAYEDTRIVLRLLNDVTHVANHDDLHDSVVRDVVLMPMMNMKILELPSLCSEYYNLLDFECCNIYQKIDHDLFKQLMAAIQLGLYTFSESISNYCRSICLKLARMNYTHLKNGNGGSLPSLAPLMNTLLNDSLSHSDGAIYNDSALYYLISCYQNEYKSFIENIVAAQSDPVVQQKLTLSVNALTADIKFDDDFQDRNVFGTKFQEFSWIASAFLTIK